MKEEHFPEWLSPAQNVVVGAAWGMSPGVENCQLLVVFVLMCVCMYIVRGAMRVNDIGAETRPAVVLGGRGKRMGVGATKQ